MEPKIFCCSGVQGSRRLQLMKPWTDQYFGSLYEEIYRKYLMTPDRARQEVAFALELLDLRGKLVLDLASGYGRHARLLARSTPVVALDRNAQYLDTARARLPQKAAKQLSVTQADMRALPFRTGSFDAVLLLFNSFGYFVPMTTSSTDRPAPAGQVWKLPQVFYERQLVDPFFGMPQKPTSQQIRLNQNGSPGGDENRIVLQEIARVLQRNAPLLLEAPNPGPLIAAIEEQPRRHVITSSYELEEEYAWIPASQVLTNRTRFRVKDREESVQYHLRLYSPSELREMLRAAGFRIRKSYGAYDGTAFSARSSEMQLLYCVLR